MSTAHQEMLLSQSERQVVTRLAELRGEGLADRLSSVSKALTGVKRTVVNFCCSNYFAPTIVLISGTVVSVLMSSMVAGQVEDEAKLRFERQASDAHHVIKSRILSYVEVIRGLAALFHTSGNVARLEFHRYVNGLNLEHSYPGFQTLNYAQWVGDDERTMFETKVRQDNSLTPSGYPDFSITPPGKREGYAVLVYQEPMATNETTFGKDLAASPAVKKALLKSRDSGELVSSGSLIRVEGPNKHIGLAMRMPVYHNNVPLDTIEQRRAAYMGSVGAGFHVQNLMRGALNQEGLQLMRFRMYDRGPVEQQTTKFTHSANNFLFDSNQLLDGKHVSEDDEEPGKLFKSSQQMEIGGRVWEVEFSAREDAIVNRLDAALPWMALFGGLLSSCALAWAFSAMTFSRSRAVKIAKAMTKNLRENQASLAEAQRTAHLGSWSLDRVDGKMQWSAETYRIFCLEPDATPSFEDFRRRVHHDDLPQLNAALEQVIAIGYRVSGEYRIEPKGRGVRWAQIIFQPAKDGNDKILNGTIMDITERKQAALLAEVEHKVTQLVASAEGPETVMPRVIEALCKGLECTGACFHMREDGETWLRYAASWGLEQGEFANFLERKKEERVLFGSGVAGHAWQKRWPLIMSSYDAELAAEARSTNPAALCSVFALPILSDDNVFGVIETFGNPGYLACEGLQKMLISVAGQIGLYFQRKSAERNLLHVASHDALTGLPNRAMFNHTLHKALARNVRYREGLAVLFIDVDRFKIVNDTLGHSAGDQLLIEFSSRLTDCLRESDIVARLGGDEFAVMIEKFNHLDDVVTVVEKILASSARPFAMDGKEFKTTASIGIAVVPNDGADVDTLLKNADVAMYRAKIDGNSYEFYSPQMNEHSLKHFTMEAALRHAVERKEMFLHFQPKLDLKSGHINGVEALLRWKHPQWGMVSPAEFIPLAEESGLIIDIGKWVLRVACQQNVEWQRQGLPAMRIAVNLSARQFRDEKLLEDVRKILQETGLAPEHLEIEVTESMVMHDAQHAIRVLHQLKELGVHLSIDDFGTGYSSLAYLRHLPVDSVKIDRSFIKDIPHEADDMAVTTGIIGLAHCLRLHVVAEGIETAEQLSFLKENGCDEIQGYFFSKPLPAADVTSLLEHNFHEMQVEVVATPGKATQLAHA